MLNTMRMTRAVQKVITDVIVRSSAIGTSSHTEVSSSNVYSPIM